MTPGASQTRSRARFESLLDRAIAHPEQQEQVERDIREEFTERVAVLVSDLDSFTASTVAHGPIPFMLVVRRMRLLAGGVFRRHGGRMLHPEADNLSAIFGSVESALAAARELHRTVPAQVTSPNGGEPITLAVGIGWGDVLNIADEHVIGPEVNFAYKLGEDIGQGGEILLTEAARRQLSLPADTFEERQARISGLDVVYYLANET